MLHDESVQWLHSGVSQTRHDGLPILPGFGSESDHRYDQKTSRRRRDAIAIWDLGKQYHLGHYGLEKDVTRAIELYEHAAELGVKGAHFYLGFLYGEGEDVEKDSDKAIRHYEAAAMCGHDVARFNLGCMEYNAENYDIALQHWMIAAKLGYEESLDEVKEMFMHGLATKAEYAEALRGCQSAVEQMRSLDRDEAKSLDLVQILSISNELKQ